MLYILPVCELGIEEKVSNISFWLCPFTATAIVKFKTHKKIKPLEPLRTNLDLFIERKDGQKNSHELLYKV